MIGKRVLVDTSVVIDFLRRKDKENSWLHKLAKKKVNLWISILTHTELYSGTSVWKSIKAKRDLEKTLSGLKLINVNEGISMLAGRIRSKLGVELPDAVIAATAIENKLSLATLNQKHFKGIRGLNLTKEA
ncbi:MAG: type II toxin-antitoxin system VapC family toxin [Patescibacteria group bacterium]|nr:type II toxin-antitoxin system VapC family toxin [Patescibacteria group bacterium]